MTLCKFPEFSGVLDILTIAFQSYFTQDKYSVAESQQVLARADTKWPSTKIHFISPSAFIA